MVRYNVLTGNLQNGNSEHTLTMLDTGNSIGYVRIDKDNTNTSTETYFYVDHVSLVQNDLEIVEENNYYPLGLKHHGYNSNPTSSNIALKKTYNGKEYQDELGLNWHDYGFRNYDAALGRWMNIDPLADAYFGLSPYTYVANNPMLLIDPDGQRIGFEYKYDDEGNISDILITVTGKIIDDSGKLSSKKIEAARKKILNGISNIKVTGTKGVKVSFAGDIEVANSESDIEKDDHVFRLVDDVSKAPGANHTNPNTKALGYGPLGENVVYLDKNSFTERTAAHEVAHSAGLKHINETRESDLYPMASGFGRFRARNANGFYTPSQATAFGNEVVNMATKLYTNNDYFGNLMHQSRVQNSKGQNAAGYEVTQEQINAITYKYNNKQLNGGQQK